MARPSYALRYVIVRPGCCWTRHWWSADRGHPPWRWRCGGRNRFDPLGRLDRPNLFGRSKRFWLGQIPRKDAECEQHRFRQPHSEVPNQQRRILGEEHPARLRRCENKGVISLCLSPRKSRSRRMGKLLKKGQRGTIPDSQSMRRQQRELRATCFRQRGQLRDAQQGN